MTLSLRGLYLLTPDRENEASFLAEVGMALMAKPSLLQYRNKKVLPRQRLAQADAVTSLCRLAGVPIIINDDVELAIALNADGVHLGHDDGDLRAARQRLGQNRWLGASCYGEIERARIALQSGADYVAFGAVFPSATKPQAPCIAFSLLQQARQELGAARIVAIGGIHLDNAPTLIDAGVDLLAVIGDVFDAADPYGRIRAYQELFHQKDGGS